MEYSQNQTKQLLDYLEKKRDSYDLYSEKWLHYNNLYQDILFSINK